MEFEYDPQKSESNKLKHEIDFEDAQKIWLDDARLEVDLNWKDELRFMVIGKIGSKLWSAICTNRKERIRIICARRSRPNEETVYEENC
jgi:uncharacterized DUF497 family protein